MEDTDNIQYILGGLIFSVKKVFHLKLNTQSSENTPHNSNINQRHDKSILIIIIQCY